MGWEEAWYNSIPLDETIQINSNLLDARRAEFKAGYEAGQKDKEKEICGNWLRERGKMELKERLVNKAVSLWKKALANPIYNNGDAFQSVFQTFVAEQTNEITTEKLDKFGENLKAKLMKDHRLYMSVDYHPSKELEECAVSAGLKVTFPIKTHQGIYIDSRDPKRGYVSMAIGYQNPALNYYPLENDRWLVTDLSGKEVSKIIEYVEGGKPEFLVEGL